MMPSSPPRSSARSKRQLATLPRAEVARASWRDFGAVIVVRDLADAVPLVDRDRAGAPARSSPMMPTALAAAIRNAGAIFLGAYTPEAIGDYVAGSNHVLPTARSARFSSGLGVLDFMKRTSILKCGPDAARRARTGRDRARRGGGARGACPLGRDQAQPAMTAPPAGDHEAPRQGLCSTRTPSGRQPRHRARARDRDLRSDRGQFLCARRP